MPLALKAQIVVTAGIVLNEPMSELTRSWQFTNEDIVANAIESRNFTYHDGLGAAMNYAATLQNPRMCNWVKVEWIWL